MRRPLALPAAALMLLVAGCFGDDGSDSGDPAERLAQAKRAMDDAASIEFRLSTDELPDGVDGVLEAEGVGTHDPAFRGTITVRAVGLPGEPEVQVVAVEDAVYAQLPFVGAYQQVDPADYGAPDPAALMDPETGLSSLLTAATDVSVQGQSRDGDEVLTELSGTVPGKAMAEVFPTANRGGEFPATFRVADDDELDTATLTGPFYGDAGDVTYQVTLEASGDPVEITAP